MRERDRAEFKALRTTHEAYLHGILAQTRFPPGRL